MWVRKRTCRGGHDVDKAREHEVVMQPIAFANVLYVNFGMEALEVFGARTFVRFRHGKGHASPNQILVEGGKLVVRPRGVAVFCERERMQAYLRASVCEVCINVA